jgi:glyoxylase-like metal-dependent hydrolase (beta-lactamase superfamily II)
LGFKLQAAGSRSPSPVLLAALLASFCSGTNSNTDPGRTPAATPAGQAAAIKLHIFDCGTLERANISRFRLKEDEVATIRMSVACYLVVHPAGTLMWDVGAVPDANWTPSGVPVTQTVRLPDGQEREVTMTKQLATQLRETGLSPAQISYVALSHYHWDHTANANAFGQSTWLVRQVERDAMFSDKPPPLTLPATYSALRSAKTLVMGNEEHDVFGDGTVVVKLAPGHTPGHQVLYVKLPQTGGVVLSGDLYHYPEERLLGRLPTFEFDQEQTAVTRGQIDAFLKSKNATLWIQHDFTGDSRLRKSPAYYQ